MSNTELIAELRDTASKGVSVWGDLQKEAADAIEALESQLAIERRHNERATNHLQDQRDALQAQLAAAQGQEPVAYMVQFSPGSRWVEVTKVEFDSDIDGATVYKKQTFFAAPIPQQPAQPVNAMLVEALQAAEKLEHEALVALSEATYELKVGNTYTTATDTYKAHNDLIHRLDKILNSQYRDRKRTALTAALTAAQQAQPPAPSDAAREYMTGYSDGREWAKPSQADAQDAARYRWLRSTTNWASNSSNERIDVRNSPELWDAAIDAAINAKGSNEHH